MWHKIGYFVTIIFISIVMNIESPRRDPGHRTDGRSQKHMSGPNYGVRYRLFAFAEENDAQEGRGLCLQL